MTSPSTTCRAAAWCSFLILPAALAAQTTVTIPCAQDNTLYESIFGDASNGAGISLFIGLNAFGSSRRALLRFDVAAALPAGARVLDARLSLNVTRAATTQPTPITGHRLLVSWGEGTSNAGTPGGGGGVASVGDATWLHRFWPGTFWTTPGGDFAAVPSWTATMPSTGTFTSNASRASAADVQSWLDAPATNFGWLVKVTSIASSTAHRVGSRETTGVRPTLTVTYLLPGQNGTWGSGCAVGAGTFAAAWIGAPVGGTTVQIGKTNAPPASVGADFFALALDPQGVSLAPGCTQYLPSAEILLGGTFWTDGAGAATTSLLLPVGFPGHLVHCQAAVLTNHALGYVVSNSALTVLQ